MVNNNQNQGQTKAELAAKAEADKKAAEAAAAAEEQAKLKADQEAKSKGSKVDTAEHDKLKASVMKYLHKLDGTKDDEQLKSPHLRVAEGHLNDLHAVIHGVVSSAS